MSSDTHGSDPHGSDRHSSGPHHDEALGVLRGIWHARGQTSADLEDAPEAKVCKNTAHLGFQPIATGDDSATGTTPVDADMRASWRRRLEREGKLGETTVREMVTESTDQRE